MRKVLEFPRGAQEVKETEAVRPSSRGPVRTVALLHGQVAGAAFAQRCRQANIHVAVLHLTDGSQPASKFASDDDAAMPWSLLGTPEGLERVAAFAKYTNAEALVTTDEFALAWLAKNRELFEPHCVLLAPEADIIAALHLKDKQCEFAREAGLRVLDTWHITTGDIAAIPESAFPVCLRPSTFSSVHPMFKAETFHSRAELAAFLKTIEWTKPLIAQPFISGPNVVVHGCRHENGEWMDLRGYMVPVKSRGFTVVLEETVLDPKLNAACKKFVELSGATGPFHFELLQDERDGAIYFLEINLRLGGTTAKALALGFDEPLMLLRAYGFTTPLAPLPEHPFRAAGSLRLLTAHAWEVMTGRAAEIAYPRKRNVRTLATLLRYAMIVRDPSLPHVDVEQWLRGCVKKLTGSLAPRPRFTGSPAYTQSAQGVDGWLYLEGIATGQAKSAPAESASVSRPA